MKLIIRFHNSIESELETFLRTYNKDNVVKEFLIQEAPQRTVLFPDLFKHMTLAIWNKGPRNKDTFQASFMIALDFLATYGYISPKSSPSRIYLTGKGKTQNSKHSGEPPAKSANFDKAYFAYVLGKAV